MPLKEAYMQNPTGELRLSFRRKQSGDTYIADQYYALPLQVLSPYYQDEDGTAFVYLLNPSGGIFQGDRLLTEVKLERQARALITTPSATKFYKMEDDHAELLNIVTVEEGAVLEYLPEYNIPYAKAKIHQQNIFKLDESAVLIASDMVIPGRVDMAEEFAYDLYASRTKIYVNGKLEAHEYVKLKPEDENILGIGVLEGYKVYASMFVYRKDLPLSLRDEVQTMSTDAKDVRIGISYITNNLASIRLLGNSTSEVEEVLSEIWGAARRHLLGKDKVRIRKY